MGLPKSNSHHNHLHANQYGSVTESEAAISASDDESFQKSSSYFFPIHSQASPTRIGSHKEIEFCFSSDSSQASDDDDDHETHLDEIPTYEQFWNACWNFPRTRRWIVTGAALVTNFSCSWIWITFAPATSAMASLWSVPTSHVNALASVYMYIPVVTTVISSVKPFLSQIHRLGAHRCFLLGAIVNVLGAAIRYMWAKDYRVVFLGTLISACSHTLITAAGPSLIASVSVDESPQSEAITNGALQCASAGYMGTAMGFAATVFLALRGIDGVMDNATLYQYMQCQLGVCCLGFFLVLLSGGSWEEAKKPAPRVSSSKRPPLPPQTRRPSLSHRKTKSPTDVTCFDETLFLLAEEKKALDLEEQWSLGDESSLLWGDAVIWGYGGDAAVGPFDHDLGDGLPHGMKEEIIPPPPVMSAATFHLESTKDTLLQFSSRKHWVHLLVSGLPMGVLYTIPVLLSQILRSSGIKSVSDDAQSSALWIMTVGCLGIVFQLSSLAGHFGAVRMTELKTFEFQDHTSHRNSATWQSILLGGATLSLLVILAASTSAATPGQAVDYTAAGYPQQQQVSLFASIAIVAGLIGSAFFLASASVVGKTDVHAEHATRLLSSTSTRAHLEEDIEPMMAAFTDMLREMLYECPGRMVSLILVTGGGLMMQNLQQNSLHRDGGNLYVLLSLVCAVATALVMVLFLEPQTPAPRRPRQIL